MIPMMARNDVDLRLSIITPCLNRANNVECSIQSVLRQGYSNVEHIVVDGGSTDSTLEVLARYPHLKVLSGRDGGMYDALNKGLNIASGDVVGFLNTDDLYADHVFQPVMEHFRDQNTQVVSGRAQIFKEDNGTLRTLFELAPPEQDKLVETAITGSTIFNAWFFRKSAIDRIGGFDPQFRISGDADLVLRLALMGVNYLALESVHYLYRQHEDSLTFQVNSDKLLKIFEDHSRFIKKHISSSEISNKNRLLFNDLYVNTCSTLANQLLSERRLMQSILWKFRALFGMLLSGTQLKMFLNT